MLEFALVFLFIVTRKRVGGGNSRQRHLPPKRLCCGERVEEYVARGYPLFFSFIHVRTNCLNPALPSFPSSLEWGEVGEGEEEEEDAWAYTLSSLANATRLASPPPPSPSPFFLPLPRTSALKRYQQPRQHLRRSQLPLLSFPAITPRGGDAVERSG